MSILLNGPVSRVDEATLTLAVMRFKALADRTRLAILVLLAESSDPLCVCHINAGFDLEQPTISHHLRVLREAGLITGARHANWVYYALHPLTEDWVRDSLKACTG